MTATEPLLLSLRVDHTSIGTKATMPMDVSQATAVTNWAVVGMAGAANLLSLRQVHQKG